jgi:hypothetical protein
VRPFGSIHEIVPSLALGGMELLLVPKISGLPMAFDKQKRLTRDNILGLVDYRDAWKHSLIIEDDADDGINSSRNHLKNRISCLTDTESISNPHFIIIFGALFEASFSN